MATWIRIDRSMGLASLLRSSLRHSAAVAGRCPVVASFVQHWFKGLEFSRNKILTICETRRRGRRHRAPNGQTCANSSDQPVALVLTESHLPYRVTDT